MKQLLKHPSAWVPIVLSLLMFGVLLYHLLFVGVTREADEGVAAHLFQLWLVFEVFAIAFFATKWLPQKPQEALAVLAIQIVAVLVVCAPVFYFQL